MARINSTPQFEGSFTPKAASQGFAPEKAIDTSRQEALRAKQQSDALAVQGRDLNRQQAIDKGIQQAEFVTEKAAMTIAHSKANANLSLIKGLAGLSTSAANALVKMDKDTRSANEQAEQVAYEDSIISQYEFGGGGLNESTEQQIDNAEEHDYQVTAQAQATAPVQNELWAEGDVNTAQNLSADMAYHREAPERRTIQQAKQMHGPWLLEKVSKLQLAGMSTEQISLEVRKLNNQFAHGVTGGSRKALLNLARTMEGNTSNAYGSLFSRRAKEQAGIAQLEETDNIASAARAQTAQEAWAQATAATANNGGTGPQGRTPLTQRRALEGLLQQYANDPVDGERRIRELMRLEGAPGNKGSILGNDKRYKALFRDAITKAQKAAQADFSHEAQQDKLAIAKTTRDFLQDPTPEKRAATIAALKEIGSVEALNEAKRLLGSGMNVSPQLELDIEIRSGGSNPYTQDELDGMLARGEISPEIHKKYGQNSPQAKALKEAQALTKPLASQIESAIKGNVFGKDGKRAKVDADQLRPIAGAAKIRAQKLQRELNRELAAWIQKNPGKDTTQEQERILNKLLEKPEYRLKASEGGLVEGWQAETTTQRPTIVAGSRDYTGMNADEVSEAIKGGLSINIYRSRLFTAGDVAAEAQSMAAGNAPSPRTAALADSLNISSRELIDAQLQGRGLPSMSALEGTHNVETGRRRLDELNSLASPDMKTSVQNFTAYGVPPMAAQTLGSLQQVNNITGDGLRGLSQTQRAVLNRIARPESGSWGYDAMNKGGSHGGTRAYGSGTGTENFGKPLTSMSVGEVLQHGAAGRIHAAGRYQFIHSTFAERVQKLGIPSDALFSKELQDYITLDYMRENPTAWVGINEKDPGAINQMYGVSREPLPPAPWLNPSVQPAQLLQGLLVSNPQSYRTIMNPRSSAQQIRAALNGAYGRQAGLLARASEPRHVYTTGNRGYGSTEDHLDAKPVSPGQIYSNKNLPMTRGELDRFVAVSTNDGLVPLSQAMEVTSTDQDHRNRNSHGVDFASYQPNRELYLTNGARVIENWVDNSAAGQGSNRLLIEVPGGKRYAFVHGTSPVTRANDVI